MISLRSIGKTYVLPHGQVMTALQDVDLEVQRDEFLVVTGRSGCGKTTLLNVMAGLARPSVGTVSFEDVDLWSMSDAEISHLRNRRVGFVFQFPSLVPSLNTIQNVMLPLRFARERPADAETRAKDLLDLVGLRERVTSYPRQLSAGQQQRVVIARALINEPELLLADEPSSDLDEQTEAEIMALFTRIHREKGIAIVMVTHARQLVKYGTRPIEMAAGRITADGHTDD